MVYWFTPLLTHHRCRILLQSRVFSVEPNRFHNKKRFTSEAYQHHNCSRSFSSFFVTPTPVRPQSCCKKSLTSFLDWGIFIISLSQHLICDMMLLWLYSSKLIWHFLFGDKLTLRVCIAVLPSVLHILMLLFLNWSNWQNSTSGCNTGAPMWSRSALCFWSLGKSLSSMERGLVASTHYKTDL